MPTQTCCGKRCFRSESRSLYRLCIITIIILLLHFSPLLLLCRLPPLYLLSNGRNGDRRRLYTWLPFVPRVRQKGWLSHRVTPSVIRTTENSEERKEEEQEEKEEDGDGDGDKVERDYGGKEKSSTSSCRPALISASRQELRCKTRDRFISAWGEGKTPPSCHPSFSFPMPRQ